MTNTSAFTSTTQNVTAYTPPMSAIWHMTSNGDCVLPRYSHGNPWLPNIDQLPRTHSSATHTADMNSTAPREPNWRASGFDRGINPHPRKIQPAKPKNKPR